MNTVILKAGREKSLRRRHPWIFSGAVKKITGSPLPGETVTIRSADGDFLALAAFPPPRRSAFGSGPLKKIRRSTAASSANDWNRLSLCGGLSTFWSLAPPAGW